MRFPRIQKNKIKLQKKKKPPLSMNLVIMTSFQEKGRFAHPINPQGRLIGLHAEDKKNTWDFQFQFLFLYM